MRCCKSPFGNKHVVVRQPDSIVIAIFAELSTAFQSGTIIFCIA
jgi:hypothetical protein